MDVTTLCYGFDRCIVGTCATLVNEIFLPEIIDTFLSVYTVL